MCGLIQLVSRYLHTKCFVTVVCVTLNVCYKAVFGIWMGVELHRTLGKILDEVYIVFSVELPLTQEPRRSPF